LHFDPRHSKLSRGKERTGGKKKIKGEGEKRGAHDQQVKTGRKILRNLTYASPREKRTEKNPIIWGKTKLMRAVLFLNRRKNKFLGKRKRA